MSYSIQIYGIITSRTKNTQSHGTGNYTAAEQQAEMERLLSPSLPPPGGIMLIPQYMRSMRITFSF